MLRRMHGAPMLIESVLAPEPPAAPKTLHGLLPTSLYIIQPVAAATTRHQPIINWLFNVTYVHFVHHGHHQSSEKDPNLIVVIHFSVSYCALEELRGAAGIPMPPRLQPTPQHGVPRLRGMIAAPPRGGCV